MALSEWVSVSYAKDSNAADNGGVLGGGQGFVGGRDKALGGAPRGALVAVDTLLRHCVN